MHSRRFACLLLGMWLAGGLVVTWLVNENSRAVDRILTQSDPNVTLRVKVLGAAETAPLLRYEAAELSRNELALWEMAQLALGTFFFLFMLFGTGEGKIPLAISLALVVCVILQRFAIEPELTSLGRITDFLPGTAATGFRAKLLVMQGAYFGFEIGKWVVTILLAGMLIGRGRTSRSRENSDHVWNKFHVVDKPDHGHVNR